MSEERPNILFILLDQMRGDCLSVLNHPVVDTPNMDEVGRSGVVFRRAYSTCPSCIAARASIFTGLSPSTHGRLGYRDRVPWRYPNMLAQLIGDHGYQTHCVGKTHFYPQRAHLGFHSLDSYEGGQNFDGLYVNDYDEWVREKTGGDLTEQDTGLTYNSWNARPSVLPEELHNNSWVATKSLEFLKRRDRTRPFFLNMSFHRPHAPLDPPQVYFDIYRDHPLPPVPVGNWAGIHDFPVDDLDAWHGRLPDDLLAQARRAYYAQIAHIDSQIGRVLRTISLKKHGPTVVLITADHGEMLGDHHMYRKTFAYEGSARVPMLLSVPNGKRGQVCDAPVALEDVYPTLLQAAEIPIPEGTEGYSMLPWGMEGVEAPQPREYVHGEHADCYVDEEAMQYITDGREKYVWFTLTGREHLFDLVSDPEERHDLALDPSAGERVKSWRQRLARHLASRPQDGLSDGENLLPGKLLPACRPELLA